jgi:hypothetical protein
VLSLEEEIGQFAIPTHSLEQYPEISIKGLDNAEAYSHFVVVEQPFEVILDHVGELLKRREPLPSKTANPIVQVG